MGMLNFFALHTFCQGSIEVVVFLIELIIPIETVKRLFTDCCQKFDKIDKSLALYC